MKKMNKYIALLSLGVVFASCENVVDIAEEPTSGQANFSKYVSIGNSLTAGYADGGVYAESQANSYPHIIAEQMMQVGSLTSFTQPTMPGNGPGYMYLKALVNGSPTIDKTAADPGFLTRIGKTGHFNNMGVPGIRAIDITAAGYGASPTAGNPYFYRMLTDATAMTSYMTAVVETDPTFFTCWLGNNDVLGYATSGGAYGVNGQFGIYLNGISPTSAFGASYGALVAQLLADKTTKGVLATIPNVTDIPFFTTVPAAPLIPLPEANATALNAGYAQYNGGLMAWNAAVSDALKRPLVNFVAGNNFPLIVDESLSDVVLPLPGGGTTTLPKYRHLTPNDLLLLTLPTSQFAAGLGTQTPIPSQYTLTPAEKANVATAVTAYNKVISDLVKANSAYLTLWDANAEFAAFKTAGYTDKSVSISTRFISGGAFSLDGVHGTPRGYAWIANRWMSKINGAFGSNLPMVSIGLYRGVKFP